MDNKVIGNKIKEIRLERNETMEQFAEHLGSDKSNVSRWERGINKPNEKTLREIATLGGIAVNEVLYGSIEHYVFSNWLPLAIDNGATKELAEEATADILATMMNEIKEKEVSIDDNIDELIKKYIKVTQRYVQKNYINMLTTIKNNYEVASHSFDLIKNNHGTMLYDEFKKYPTFESFLKDVNISTDNIQNVIEKRRVLEEFSSTLSIFISDYGWYVTTQFAYVYQLDKFISSFFMRSTKENIMNADIEESYVSIKLSKDSLKHYDQIVGIQKDANAPIYYCLIYKQEDMPIRNNVNYLFIKDNLMYISKIVNNKVLKNDNTIPIESTDFIAPIITILY